jgi:hypothetical protein
MVRPRLGAPGPGLRQPRARWRTAMPRGLAGALVVGGMLTGTGCRSAAASSLAQNSISASSLVQASENSAAGPWRPLFDGKSLAGWHNFKTPGAPATGWSAIDGVLVRTGDGGDLVTDREYANYEFELEWKVGPRGNSGVIYRIDPTADVTYTSGPELQILDNDRHPDGKNALTSAGANYALHAAPAGVVKPANSWNAIRLVVNGQHVEHWLNGAKVVQYELGSADWEARRTSSKFANSNTYGRATRGFIALQDHGDRVEFRNIRLRELP